MSYKNPYIKSGNEKTYTVPEYTPDNYFAQRDWNKEIANNKQGYMAVDIMSMKDFYDAGGYSFVDDYRAELTDIDAAYDRALPGYGVKGEQMAQAGLVGSGYSDYLGGQAYAGRVAGQALARQNAMANSNSFRAAYNQYVAQQKEKREANLQTVVDRAISVNMNPDNFVTIATRLGIPQADAERGLEQLIAYYQGLGMDGSGTISGTNTNTENSYTGLNTMQAQEAKEMKSALQAALKGYVNPETGEEVAPTAATIDAALAKYYGSTYSKDDPRVQAAIKELQFDELTQVESFAVTGQFTAAKTQLDALVTAGVVDENSEQYKATLAKVQAEAGKTITTAVTAGDLKSYQKVLEQYGYEGEITEDNASQLLADYVDAFYENGVLSDDEYDKFYVTENNAFMKTVEKRKDLYSLAANIIEDKTKISEKAYATLIGQIDVDFFEKGLGNNKTKRISIILPNGEEFKYDIDAFYGDSNDKFIEKSTKGYKIGDYMGFDGKLYVFTGKENQWTRVLISAATEDTARIVADILQNKKSS